MESGQTFICSVMNQGKTISNMLIEQKSDMIPYIGLTCVIMNVYISGRLAIYFIKKAKKLIEEEDAEFRPISLGILSLLSGGFAIYVGYNGVRTFLTEI